MGRLVRAVADTARFTTTPGTGAVRLTDDGFLLGLEGARRPCPRVRGRPALPRAAAGLDRAAAPAQPCDRAGADHADEYFVVLGSASGSGPTSLFGVDVPLTWDPYTDLVVMSGGGNLVYPWIGSLDADGRE
ncbi:MAG: hypothetical protein R3F34_10275 [Planctomycetota bacterium]